MNTRNLSDYLAASAAGFPDRLAVAGPDGDAITYAELNRQADAVAGFLLARGVKRGDRVGVVLPKSIPAVVAIFGIMKAGAAYVPVDFTAPIERGRRILTDCKIRALIVDSRALAIVPDESEPAPAAVIVIAAVSETVAGSAPLTSFASVLKHEGPSIDCYAEPGDLAYILYTSGSTGVPKGVMITHGNALSYVESCSAVYSPRPEDRFSSHPPFHFDFSVLDIYLAIKHGAALYLISEDLCKNPKELARFISKNKLTIWSSTPTALMLLVQFGNMEEHDASSLRIVTFGGEVFPVKHLRELQRHWPAPLYLNIYGPTETTVACTFARIPRDIPRDRETPYPIGFPYAHCRTVVLDDEGRELPEGEEGLLHVSGPSIFAGYWNRPAENAAAFVHRDGVRWYNTGDLVRWDRAEGFMFFGRKDSMVKRRGFRIELGEIEHALYSHPRVCAAAVVSIPDSDAGVKIVAFLSCQDGEAPSIVELKTFCATKMPAYMSPDRFIIRSELPKTSTDKLDYQSLRREALGVGVHAAELAAVDCGGV